MLSDPKKRAAYDQFGHAGVDPSMGGGGGGFGGAESFSDIFGDVFGDIFGGGRQQQRGGVQRGADLRYILDLSLEEAVAGSEVKSAYPCWRNVLSAVVAGRVKVALRKPVRPVMARVSYGCSKDYFQAGKSVEGMQSVKSVAEIITEYSSAIAKS